MTTNDYLSADDLLGTFGDFREADFTHPMLRGKLRLREVSARTYFGIVAAGAEDAAMYHAMWAQAGIVNPQTKQPLLTPFQVEQMAEGRQRLLQDIADAVVRLSRVGAADLEQFRDSDDDEQPDAPGGAGDADGDAGPGDGEGDHADG